MNPPCRRRRRRRSARGVWESSARVCRTETTCIPRATRLVQAARTLPACLVHAHVRLCVVQTRDRRRRSTQTLASAALGTVSDVTVSNTTASDVTVSDTRRACLPL